MRNFLMLPLLCFCIIMPVHAAVEDSGGAAGAGGEKSVSIGSIWDGITRVFDDIISGSDGIKEKAEPKKNSKELIEVRRLDDLLKTEDKSKKGSDAKINTPYKVYQAPIVGGSAFSNWDKAAFQNAANRTAQTSEKKNYVIPPVGSLPKQFMPIFPFGAQQGTQPQRLPIASNNPLLQNHTDVQRVIILVHDIARNAVQGIAMLTTLGGSSGSQILMLAPQFPLEVDIKRFADYLPKKGRNIVRWPIDQGWSEGGMSISRHGSISSFTALDILLLFLSDRSRFPNLRDVVIAGHGMGGDFVQRYAAAGMAPDLLKKDKINIRFAVANAGSYLYFTNQRPLTKGLVFGLPKDDKCDGGNSYPYGLKMLAPYARRTGGEAIRLRYPVRHVTYIVGDKIKDDNYLDSSCSAMLQGKTRLLRARAYSRHVMQSFGDAAQNQNFHAIRNGGYDPVAMFGSSCGLSVLFGNGVCK